MSKSVTRPAISLKEIFDQVWNRERDRIERARRRTCLWVAQNPDQQELAKSDLITLTEVGNGERPLADVLNHETLWRVVYDLRYDAEKLQVWREESRELGCPQVTLTSWEVACNVFGEWARKCVPGFQLADDEQFQTMLWGHYAPIECKPDSPDERLPGAFDTLEDTEIHDDLLCQLEKECAAEFQKMGLPKPAGTMTPMTDGEKRLWDALCGRAVPGIALAKELDTSPETVRGWKSRLVRSGYCVENRRGRGYYRPDAPPDDLSVE